jgi:hypothetical protein
VHVARSDADVAKSSGFHHFGQRAPSGQRMADERVPAVVDRLVRQAIWTETTTRGPGALSHHMAAQRLPNSTSMLFTILDFLRRQWTFKGHVELVDSELSVRLGARGVLCRTLVTDFGSESPTATNAKIRQDHFLQRISAPGRPGPIFREIGTLNARQEGKVKPSKP